MRYAYVGEADRLPLGLLFAPEPKAPPKSHAAETRKMLVLSVSAGAGHVRAADAICSHANALGMGKVAHHVDVMDYVSAGMRKIYTGLYLTLVDVYPRVWSFVYHRTHAADPDGLTERMRRASERWSAYRLLAEVERRSPDAIVCTHFMPAEILARLKREGKLDCPLWVQVTDFDLHRMWVHEGVTGYFVGNDEIAFRLRSRGVPAGRIHVTGIPVMPGFSRRLDRIECARELGIDPERITVLLMGGGAGLGRLDEIAEHLLAGPGDFQLIALAGRNAVALEALQALAACHPGRLVPHGYTHHVERLMACCDMAITKPGGLTTSECLAMGLPMILNQPIPGQEERNADYLLEQGVALKACDLSTLDYRVRQLIANPAMLDAMRARALLLGRAGAARDVVKTVLELDSGLAG